MKPKNFRTRSYVFYRRSECKPANKMLTRHPASLGVHAAMLSSSLYFFSIWVFSSKSLSCLNKARIGVLHWLVQARQWENRNTRQWASYFSWPYISTLYQFCIRHATKTYQHFFVTDQHRHGLFTELSVVFCCALGLIDQEIIEGNSLLLQILARGFAMRASRRAIQC